MNASIASLPAMQEQTYMFFARSTARGASAPHRNASGAFVDREGFPITRCEASVEESIKQQIERLQVEIDVLMASPETKDRGLKLTQKGAALGMLKFFYGRDGS